MNALIFDLDGTLCETIEDIAASSNHALNALGRPERSTAEVKTFVGRGLDHLLLLCLGDAHAPLLAQARKHFEEHYRVRFCDRSYLYPDAAAALPRLRGIPKAVLSNKPTEFCVALLERVGALHEFDVVLGADAVPERKPAAAAAFAALDRLGVAPADRGACWLIGDNEVDLETARNAGLRCALVARGYGDAGRIRALGGPDVLLQSLDEGVEIFMGSCHERVNRGKS